MTPQRVSWTNTFINGGESKEGLLLQFVTNHEGYVRGVVLSGKKYYLVEIGILKFNCWSSK